MSSCVFFPSSLILSFSSFHHSLPRLGFQLPHQHFHHLRLSSPLPSSLRSIKSFEPNEGTVSVINFEDLVEKDWSFLDIDNLNSLEEQNRKSNRIISAGEIKDTSRVLVSIGTENFIDRLVESSPCQLLLVVHDSLFSLAMIKEKYDEVKCWQGEIIYVPEKWVPFDVVFLTYLPALPFQLDQVFLALAQRCSPGARVVISHPQGKGVVEQQRKDYPDVVISDLPDKLTLEKVALDHSFDLTLFEDEPGFYLAVLKFSGKGLLIS